MTKLLVLKSSILEKESISNYLIDYFLDNFKATFPASNPVIRDLTNDELPELSAAGFAAFKKTELQSEEERNIKQLSDSLIEELNAADCVMVAVPMYNLSVPVSLKKWVDLICRAGVTFKYSNNGVQGLIDGNKKAVLVAVSGGNHQGTSHDLAVDFMRNIFTFIGIKDISIAYANAVNINEDYKIKGLNAAKSELDSYLKSLILTA